MIHQFDVLHLALIVAGLTDKLGLIGMVGAAKSHNYFLKIIKTRLFLEVSGSILPNSLRLQFPNLQVIVLRSQKVAEGSHHEIAFDA